MDYSNWISIPEAGRVLGLNRQQAWFLVRKGDLEAIQFGRSWLVNPVSVSSYKEARLAKQAERASLLEAL